MNQDEPRDKKRKSRFYLMVLSDEAHVMNGAGKARDDVGWHPPTIFLKIFPRTDNFVLIFLKAIVVA